MIQFSIHPYFGTWPTLVGIALIVVAMFLYMREPGQLSRRQKFQLAVLRLLIIAVIFLTLLRPGLTFSRDTRPENVVAVVVDQSLSMSLPSGVNSQTRWEVALGVTKSIGEVADELSKSVQLRLFTFDRSLHEVSDQTSPGFNNALGSLTKPPVAAQTELAAPLKELVDQLIDPPLQSVVWITDGRQTAEGSNVSPRQISRQLAESNVPLYAVGIGPRSDAEKSLDQWVDGVPEQVEAFTKNIVRLRGLMRVVGLANRPLQLVTTIRDADGTEVQQISQEVVPNSLEQTIPFTVPVSAENKGSYEVEIAAAPVDGEATLQNNKQVCFLNVRDTGSRVLYIEGEPRAELKFISRALSDSPDLNLEILRVYRNTKSSWPLNKLAPIIASGVYDCIILGDVDSDALGKETLGAISDQVEKGAGLITLGGFHTYGPGGYASTPLNLTIPVMMEGFPRQSFRGELNLAGQSQAATHLVLKRRHPILEIAATENLSEAELQKVWDELPPLEGYSLLGSLRSEAGIQLLAESHDGHPLIVARDLGRGRVLTVAFDSTYLWWRGGFADVCRRFWRQSVFWAMQSQDREPGLKITMDRRRLRLGADASYRIEWTGSKADEPMPAGLVMQLETPTAQQRPLLPSQSTGGAVDGKVASIAEPGRYYLIASVTQADGKLYTDRLPFDVVDEAIELIQGSPDWQLLSQIVELNKKAGGQLIGPEETDTLISLLKQRADRAKVTLVESHYLGEGPVDSWMIFLLLSTLWTVQWIIRKRWSLA